MAKSKSQADHTPTADTRVMVLHGPDQFTKQEKLDQLRAALEKAHGTFESYSFDGKSSDLAAVLDELRTFSLMQTHKLVIVDRAEEFVSEQTRPALERYAASPVEHATLVLRADTWRKGNLDKAVEKVGGVVDAQPPSPREVARWAVQRAKTTHHRQLDPRAAEVLAMRTIGDRVRVDTELGKLALMAEGEGPITVELVEQVVERSSEEQAWAIQEAVLQAIAAAPRQGARAAGPLLDKVAELMLTPRQSDVALLYFMGDLMRKLYLTAVLRRQGLNDKAALTAAGVWGFKQGAYFPVLRQLDERKLARLFDAVMAADRQSKSGIGDPITNLERFCVQLADSLQRPAA